MRAAASCIDEGGNGAVRTPKLVRQIDTGETGWFSSPGLVDLDGDGRLEIVAPFYSTFVYDAKGRLLGKGQASEGRVYPPSVVADLEGDGVPDIVVAGNEGTVAAYEFSGGGLHLKDGWPASTTSGGQSPEARGLAAADLDGDGRVEVVATTTNTSPTGSQVFVFDASGSLFQPEGGHSPAWPRYNQLAGPGNDLRFNQVGNHGYGAYGENVAIGNIDDDPELEIIATFDNHQINAFNLDGTSVLASPWFTNRESEATGERMGWGQFIRWADPRVEKRHYHQHTGAWPSPASQAWLQWTASPPAVADLDGDGRNEVIGIPNVERHIPYRTQAHAFMVLDGAYGDGQTVGSTSPRLRDAADVQQARPPTQRRLVPAHRHPRADRGRHPRRRPARDRRGPARRQGLRGRAGRRPALDRRLRAAARQDVRLRGRRGRPEQGRHPRAGLRHLLATSQRRTPVRALGPAGRSSRSRG